MLLPIAAVVGAAALLYETFQELQSESGPIADFLAAIGVNLDDVVKAIENVKEGFQEFGTGIADQLSGVGAALTDLLGNVKSLGTELLSAGTQFNPIVDAVNEFAKALGLVPLDAFKLGLDLILTAWAPWLAAILNAKPVLDTLSFAIRGVKDAMDLATGDAQNSAGAFDASTDALNRLDQANKNVSESAANAAMGIKTMGDAGTSYSETLQDLLAKQISMVGNVGNLQIALEQATAAFNAGQISAGQLAYVQAQLDSATKSLYGTVQQLPDAFINYKTALDNTSDDMKVFIQAENDMLAAHQNMIKQIAATGMSLDQYWADVRDQAERSAEDYQNLLPPMAQAVLAVVDPLHTAAQAAKDAQADFQNLFAVNPAPLNDLAAAFKTLGVNTKDVKPDLDEANAALQTVLDHINDTGWDNPKVIQALSNIDKMAQQVGKVSLVQMADELGDVSTKLINQEAPLDIINGKMQQWEAAINKLAKTDLPDAIAQQEQYIGQLQRMSASQGDVLRATADLDQMQIKWGNDTGESASAAVYSLEGVRLKQQQLALESHGVADQMVNAINDVVKGFDQLGNAMADAIVNGKNLGDALVQTFQKIATSILGDLINAALVPLKTALIEMMGSLIPGFGSAAAGIVTGINAIGPASASASTGLTSLGTAATAAASAITAAGSSLAAANSAQAASAATVTAAQSGEAAAMAAEVGADSAAVAATVADTAAITTDTAAEIADAAATGGEAAAMAAEAGVTAADAAATGADTAAKTADAVATTADTVSKTADTIATTADTVATTADTVATVAQTVSDIAETAATIADTVAQIAFASAVSAVAGVIGAIAGIVGDVYLAAVDTKLFHIETSLLEIRNETENRRADAWSQFGQMYDRLGECKRDLDAIMDLIAGGSGTTSTSGSSAPNPMQGDLDTMVILLTDVYNETISVFLAVNDLQAAMVNDQGFATVISDLNYIYAELVKIFNGVTSGGGAQANAIIKSSADIISNATGNAAGIQHGLDTTVQTIQQQIDAALQSLAADKAAAAAATNTTDELVALQKEYADLNALAILEQKNGDALMVQMYTQQAQAVASTITALGGTVTTAVDTSGAATQAAIGTAANQTTATTSGIGTTITNAVDNSANSLVQAVNNAALTIGAAVATAAYASGSGSTYHVPTPSVNTTGGATPGPGAGEGAWGMGGSAPASNLPPGSTTGAYVPPATPPAPTTGGTQTIVPPGTYPGGGLSQPGPYNPNPIIQPGTGSAAGYPSYDGGGYVPADTPANLHAGEYVLDPTQVNQVLALASTAQAIPEGGQQTAIPWGTLGPALSGISDSVTSAAQEATDAQSAATQKLLDQLNMLESQLASAIANGATVQADEIGLQITAVKQQLAKAQDTADQIAANTGKGPRALGAPVSDSGVGVAVNNPQSGTQIDLINQQINLASELLAADLGTGASLDKIATDQATLIGLQQQVGQASQDATTTQQSQLQQQLQLLQAQADAQKQLLSQDIANGASLDKITADQAALIAIQQQEGQVEQQILAATTKPLPPDPAVQALAQQAMQQANALSAAMTWLGQQQGISTNDQAIAAATYASDAAHGSMPVAKTGGSPFSFSGYNPYTTPTASAPTSNVNVPGAGPRPLGAPVMGFDTGGMVPYDMIAMVHQNEAVLPPDLTAMLRRAASQPAADSATSRGNITYNINMPVTVQTSQDGAQLAKNLVRQLKLVIPAGGLQ